MSKPSEPRHPRSPTKTGEQQPGGRSSQSDHKPNPDTREDGAGGHAKDVRQAAQKPAKGAAKPQLRAARGDDDLMSQGPKKS